MAAIDCCYLDNWKEYQELREFLKGKKFKTPRGVEVEPEYILYNWEEKDFTENGKPHERRIFNSPVYIDNWLYHNCDLPFIQEWLKSRYLDGGYCKGQPHDITNDLKFPEYEPCTRVKVVKKGRINCPQMLWYVDIDMEVRDIDGKPYRSYLHYNEDYDFWVLPDEDDEWTISGPILDISIKAIIRKILKKWKLPKGCRVTVKGRLIGDDWILETK